MFVHYVAVKTKVYPRNTPDNKPNISIHAYLFGVTARFKQIFSYFMAFPVYKSKPLVYVSRNQSVVNQIPQYGASKKENHIFLI